VTSHFGLMCLFAFCVSVVFATLMRDGPGEQLRFGAQLFGGFVGLGVIAGWVVYFLPF
jgi:hypothetical protein